MAYFSQSAVIAILTQLLAYIDAFEEEKGRRCARW